MKNKWIGFWAGAALLLAGLQACGGGGFESLFISADDERALGDSFNIQVKNGSMLEDGDAIFVPKTAGDSALVNYYQSLGQKVVNSIDAEDWDHILATGTNKATFFKFQIIKSEQVNAFAVPGGYVYFYTSIFKEFQSESELIGVIAHEIGHIVLHHSRESLLKQYAGSAALDALLGEGSAGALVGELGLGLTLLNTSRENEFEADSMGVYYSAKTGVAATGIQTFFSRGVEWEGTKCIDPTGTDILKVFSTHPPSCDRIAKAKERVAALPAAVQAQSDNAETYKAMVAAATLK